MTTQSKDPLFSLETFDMDNYFTEEVQADLRRGAAEIDAGRHVEFDPLKDRKYRTIPKAAVDA